jgi:hypothetical protein
LHARKPESTGAIYVYQPLFLPNRVRQGQEEFAQNAPVFTHILRLNRKCGIQGPSGTPLKKAATPSISGVAAVYFLGNARLFPGLREIGRPAEPHVQVC